MAKSKTSKKKQRGSGPRLCVSLSNGDEAAVRKIGEKTGTDKVSRVVVAAIRHLDAQPEEVQREAVADAILRPEAP